MPRSILVPVDGSNFAEHALPYALGVARRTGARIHFALVHVPFEIVSPSYPLAEEMAERELEQRDRDEAYIEQLVRRLATPEVEYRTALLRGHIASAIGRYVEDERIDLVVMTTHGRGGLQRAWLGSTADSLLRRLMIPLLLVRPAEETREIGPGSALEFSRVLAALDGSGTAEQALRDAIELGVAGDAAITLAHVLQPPITAYSPYIPHAVQITQDEVAARRESMSRYLDGLLEEPWLQGRKVMKDMRVDYHAAHAILELARKADADLIVLGTHGRGGLRRMVLGSVADKVIRATYRPVLVHRGLGFNERMTFAEPRSKTRSEQIEVEAGS
ncbi:MAG TPA: universal stress protein [Longimicrobiales bacterium]|nr:universal stress protein [Longimicrobiales bacterium]